MRIVAGSARGRTIKTPRSSAIRPTADRVRESIFNTLGQWMDGQRVLDLYAGTGALGLEAVSRGAVEAVLVDSGREAVSLCRENARALGFEKKATVMAMQVDRALDQLRRSRRRFDIIFADPPYASEAIARTLDQAQWVLQRDGVCVMEHDKHESVPLTVGRLALANWRGFGATQVAYFRFLDRVQSDKDTGSQ